jgi:hypothetical protein
MVADNKDARLVESHHVESFTVATMDVQFVVITIPYFPH